MLQRVNATLHKQAVSVSLMQVNSSNRYGAVC